MLVVRLGGTPIVRIEVWRHRGGGRRNHPLAPVLPPLQGREGTPNTPNRTQSIDEHEVVVCGRGNEQRAAAVRWPRSKGMVVCTGCANATFIRPAGVVLLVAWSVHQPCRARAAAIATDWLACFHSHE